MNYELGDYISSEKGKLEIKNSKERLIKLAKKEIKKWQNFLKNLEEPEIEEIPGFEGTNEKLKTLLPSK